MSDNSELEYQIFKNIVHQPDGLEHRITYMETTTRYAIPVEIVVDQTRVAVAITATTPKPVEQSFLLEAEFFASLAIARGGPRVELDEATQKLTAYSFRLIEELDCPDAFWNAVWDVTARLQAVVYQVDLGMRGVKPETVARISDQEWSVWSPALRHYRPFKPSGLFRPGAST